MSGPIFEGSLDRPTLAGLGRLLDALAQALAAAEVADRPRQAVMIAADELVSNVLNHREGRDRPRVELRVERTEPAGGSSSRSSTTAASSIPSPARRPKPTRRSPSAPSEDSASTSRGRSPNPSATGATASATAPD